MIFYKATEPAKPDSFAFAPCAHCPPEFHLEACSFYELQPSPDSEHVVSFLIFNCLKGVEGVPATALPKDRPSIMHGRSSFKNFCREALRAKGTRGHGTKVFAGKKTNRARSDSPDDHPHHQDCSSARAPYDQKEISRGTGRRRFYKRNSGSV